MSSIVRILGAKRNSAQNTFEILNSAACKKDSIVASLKSSSFKGKSGEFRVLFNVDGGMDKEENVVGVVGLGNGEEIRTCAANAIAQIRSLDRNVAWTIAFDECSVPINWKQLAEGSTLSTYSFNHLKAKDKQSAPINISSSHFRGADAKSQWRIGEILGQSQNIARNLKETPANLMTPTIFAERALSLFEKDSLVKVFIRDQDWAKEEGMGAFLSVTAGTKEPSKFLEIHYRGAKDDSSPLALVGKGVTFDSGGISIKPSAEMAMMKGDMGGAAAVLSSLWGIVQLGLPLNVVAVMPLCENMPSGSATKPGDVVKARNGLTIEVDNTDAEGRLILADAIHYVGSKFKPRAIVELSTLTGAMDVALGEGYAGVFSSSDDLWSQLQKAGLESGDEFWRMPLNKVYSHQIKSNVADLKNVGGRSAGACTAAIFLKSFVPEGIPFAHIDIAGVMHAKRSSGLFSTPGMTGRPTRSIIEFAKLYQ